MTVAGLVIAGIGLLVIWLVGHGIARPLKQMWPCSMTSRRAKVT